MHGPKFFEVYNKCICQNLISCQALKILKKKKKIPAANATSDQQAL